MTTTDPSLVLATADARRAGSKPADRSLVRTTEAGGLDPELLEASGLGGFAAAATIELHVRPDGNDATGTGTELAPFLTLAAAISAIGAADSVTIQLGMSSYSGSITAATLRRLTLIGGAMGTTLLSSMTVANGRNDFVLSLNCVDSSNLAMTTTSGTLQLASSSAGSISLGNAAGTTVKYDASSGWTSITSGAVLTAASKAAATGYAPAGTWTEGQPNNVAGALDILHTRSAAATVAAAAATLAADAATTAADDATTAANAAAAAAATATSTANSAASTASSAATAAGTAVSTANAASLAATAAAEAAASKLGKLGVREDFDAVGTLFTAVAGDTGKVRRILNANAILLPSLPEGTQFYIANKTGAPLPWSTSGVTTVLEAPGPTPTTIRNGGLMSVFYMTSTEVWLTGAIY